MKDNRPDYSNMGYEELLDCWQWVDDRAYPDRAIELYQRIYSESQSGTEPPASDGVIASLFSLLSGSSNFGQFALEMELDRLESELRLKKQRVETLIAQRQPERSE